MKKHYHLIGIGGIGMSGIAHLLLCRGVKVSGSDLKEGNATQELKKLGAAIFIGHNAKNIQGAEVVVYSSAINEANPEIIEAKKLKVPLIRRAEALAELMNDKTVITVTGSHGKTTTTSLVSCLLLEAGLMPTVAIGGILKNIDTNACLGNGKYFVAEADESDGSFLCYRPHYSIIINIDREHLDYYGDFDKELTAFEDFVSKTVPEGCIFACSDDSRLKNIVKNSKRKYRFFGIKEEADIYPRNIEISGLNSAFDCFQGSKFISRFSLPLGGVHNISNALAVIALGLELGIELELLKKALYGYKGAGRRLEKKFSNSDYLILDDYAHHPTEIKATLDAVKNIKSKKVIAVFQPHRYTRTKILLEDFAKSLDLADELIITDIYAASEQPIEGVNSLRIVDKIKEYNPKKKVIYLPKEDIKKHILSIARKGDLVITLGAGDITKISDELAEEFKK